MQYSQSHKTHQTRNTHIQLLKGSPFERQIYTQTQLSSFILFNLYYLRSYLNVCQKKRMLSVYILLLSTYVC